MSVAYKGDGPKQDLQTAGYEGGDSGECHCGGRSAWVSRFHRIRIFCYGRGAEQICGRSGEVCGGENARPSASSSRSESEQRSTVPRSTSPSAIYSSHEAVQNKSTRGHSARKQCQRPSPSVCQAIQQPLRIDRKPPVFVTHH